MRLTPHDVRSRTSLRRLDMSEVTLENVLALNEQLVALADAGVPLALAPGGSREELRGTIERIDRALAVGERLGQPLGDATSYYPDMPPAYRSALEAGLRSGHLTATLDGLTRQASAENSLRGIVGRSLIPPLIVLALALVGLSVLCLGFSPALEGIYEQTGETPSGLLAVLVVLREWLPYWGVLVPAALLVGIVLWLRGWGNWQRLIPGYEKCEEAVRNAEFARQLRLLLENGVPVAEGLPLAAAVTDDKDLLAAAAALGPSDAAPDPGELRGLPPLLRWALAGDPGSEPLTSVLRFTEDTYRLKAERLMSVWRFAVPTILGALLGGAVVLAYGLAVFGPVVQLLKDLSLSS